VADWTDADKKLVADLWAQGLSALQISKRIGGGRTRNSVIGIVHRNGLRRTAAAWRASVGLGARLTRFPAQPSAPGTPSASAYRAPPVKRDTHQNAGLAFGRPARPVFILCGDGAVLEKPPGHAPKAEAKGSQPLPNTIPVPFLHTTHRQCRWPVGGEGADMLCCGLKTPQDGPYCVAHARDAFQPQAASKARNGKDLERSLRRYA
jgi:GcrA cell cycle regulator